MEHTRYVGHSADLECRGYTEQGHAIRPGAGAAYWPQTQPSTTYRPAFGQDGRSGQSESEGVPRPLVMVVDDSQTVRKILEVCLGRAGYEVVSFEDGVQALRWLISPVGRVPNLTCVDIGLPHMDGYEVIRYLRTKPDFERTAFVMISRRDAMLDRLKARLAGAKAYLSKPFKTAEVVAVVGELLAARLARPAQL